MVVSLTPNAEKPAPHQHLEIHALIDGGYVIREGRFDGMVSDRGDEARWNWKQERAAFATLDAALKWMGKRMVRKSPD